MATATVTAPIRERQINNTLYVGEAGVRTIQAAVDLARTIGGEWYIVIPHGYPDTDLISSLIGGTTAINIHDERDARIQIYTWQGADYQPEAFLQKRGFVATGEPIEFQASAIFGFDPQGTGGVGTCNIRVQANPGKGWPAMQLFLEPQDGSGAPWTMWRADMGSDGYPRVQHPASLELYTPGTRFADHFQLWIGEIPDAPNFFPGKGMYVWAKPAENCIVLQGKTTSTGAFDQTLRLNPLGGDIQLGQGVAVTQAGAVNYQGDLTGNTAHIGYIEGNEIVANTGLQTPTFTAAAATITNLDAGTVTADEANANTLHVTTAAITNLTATGNVNMGGHKITNVADGVNPNDAVNFKQLSGSVFLFPPAGVVTSTGSAWGTPLDPTSLATWPGAGVPVSTGTGWGTPIDPTKIVVKNPTGDTVIDRGWHIFDIQGNPPAPTSGNGGVLPAAYVRIMGAFGQDTTGTTGQTAGSGGAALVTGGDGGAAPAGSTNGNGGGVYITGGRADKGAGTKGAPGSVFINNNWGDTYIGGNAGASVKVAYGGALTSDSYIKAFGFMPAIDVSKSGTAIGVGSNTEAWLRLTTAGAPVNQHVHDFYVSASSGSLHGLFTDDAGVTNQWLRAARSGNTPSTLDLYHPTVTVNGPSANGSYIRQAFYLTTPILSFWNNGAGADLKQWSFGMTESGTLHGTCGNDAGTAANDWLTVTRSGATPSTVKFGCDVLAPTVNANGFYALGTQDASAHVILGEQSNCPLIYMLRPNSGTANQRTWLFQCWDDSQLFCCVSDDGTAVNPWMIASRSGASPSKITMYTDLVANHGLIVGQGPTSPYTASQMRMLNGGADSYLDITGPNTTTRGMFHVRCMNSDTTGLIDVIRSDANGALSFGGAAIALAGGSGPRLFWDGGSSFLEGAPSGRLLINQQSGNGSICQITGSLSVSGGSKSFVTTHPLDSTKDLYHSTLEGPENAVFYRGEVITESGTAEVTLPDYFEALVMAENRSVQLTQVERDGDNFSHLTATRVTDGKFTIWSSEPSVVVAWEVKAVRGDIAPLEVVREKEPPHAKTWEPPSRRLEEMTDASAGTDRLGKAETRKHRTKVQRPSRTNAIAHA